MKGNLCQSNQPRSWMETSKSRMETSMETLKLDGNFDDLLCYFKVYFTHKRTDSMSEICMDTHVVLVKSRFLPTETHDMLDFWEVVG